MSARRAEPIRDRKVLTRRMGSAEAWRDTKAGMWAWLLQRVAAVGLLAVIVAFVFYKLPGIKNAPANAGEEPKGEVVRAEAVEVTCNRPGDAEEANADDGHRERRAHGQTLHELDAHARREVRIFAVGLLAAAPARIAEDVDVRRPEGQALIAAALAPAQGKNLDVGSRDLAEARKLASTVPLVAMPLTATV